MVLILKPNLISLKYVEFVTILQQCYEPHSTYNQLGQIYSHSHYLPSSDFNNNRQVIYNHFNTNKSSRKNLIDFHRYSLPSLTTRSASVHQRHLENLMFFDESYKDDASVFGAVQGNVKDDSSEVESCRIIERKKSLAEVAANKNPNDESSEVKAKLIELIG